MRHFRASAVWFQMLLIGSSSQELRAECWPCARGLSNWRTVIRRDPVATRRMTLKRTPRSERKGETCETDCATPRRDQARTLTSFSEQRTRRCCRRAWKLFEAVDNPSREYRENDPIHWDSQDLSRLMNLVGVWTAFCFSFQSRSDLSAISQSHWSWHPRDHRLSFSLCTWKGTNAGGDKYDNDPFLSHSRISRVKVPMARTFNLTAEGSVARFRSSPRKLILHSLKWSVWSEMWLSDKRFF
jgi:hypothetical protein